ncbi:NAD(P)H nitroreductase [Mycolicibacterium moriokaense]|nr:NAD(P)H nitroreductase [Mycolicibacterium moriokaense]
MTRPDAPPQPISAQQVAGIVELACHAPSLHNSQPWRWLLDGAVLALYADHQRVAHHTDVTGGEVIMSCGAALDHLQVAAAAAGWQPIVDRYPDSRNHDLLASISFHPAQSANEHERILGEAISRRRTDRLAFAAPEPWAELEQTLRGVVEHTAVVLDVIDDSGRPALADASRRTEQHRRDDASYRYELLWWTHHSESDDGLPAAVLASPAEAARVDVARDFPAYGSGDRRPEIDRDRANVLVLSTFDDSPENTLRCGEALSRLLLECTAAGFATCTLTHLLEVHAGREAVRRITGRRAEPQVLIRVGRAAPGLPEPVRTRRRPVDEVLQVR